MVLLLENFIEQGFLAPEIPILIFAAVILWWHLVNSSLPYISYASYLEL